MEHRLLLIETSATQRYVATNFLEEAGFGVRNAENYALALELLEQQFSDPEAGAVDCVLLSWPVAPDADLQGLLQALESPDYHDLPVIVLSQNMPAQARAWVAGREHTVLANWREYKSVAGVLERLLGEPGSDAAAVVQPPKFSNADIAVLVVDDSPSIRYALSDLLSLHGYRVSVVADSAEALAALERQRYDVAIIDYYLREETGDQLVRQLLAHPAGGDLTCAVLTGNYADHIIQQSLRAGAVECMFKNESSELLLARVDAISRLVRGRSQQHSDRSRLYAAVSALEHAVIGIDGRGELNFANPPACALLRSSAESLRGLAARAQILSKLPEPQWQDMQLAIESGADVGAQRAEIAPMQGMPFAVDYHAVGLGAGEGLLLCFAKPDGRPAVAAAEPAVAPATQPGVNYSYLMLSVEFAVDGGGDWRSVAANEKLVKLVALRLSARVLQADRFQYLGQGLFAVVLSHRSPESGAAAARQLCALVVALERQLGKARVAVHASLTPMANAEARDRDTLLLARKGTLLAKKQGVNYLYLAERKQLLPVQPPAAAPAAN